MRMKCNGWLYDVRGPNGRDTVWAVQLVLIFAWHGAMNWTTGLVPWPLPYCGPSRMAHGQQRPLTGRVGYKGHDASIFTELLVTWRRRQLVRIRPRSGRLAALRFHYDNHSLQCLSVYTQFLGKRYRPEDKMVRTHNKTSTIVSAYLIEAGMTNPTTLHLPPRTA